ncbi:conserved Plasmodium protein, unknown function [Plasmodium berghei]|uniref:Uncharacterized protein n=1 Tax=Plasmodium berghei TaxID=5821 RepID=A0A1C6YF80_PLABE|nr:conserved Plasmodium protein, unknown function [Plasmodium berghei]
MLGKMKITNLVVLYIQFFFFCKSDDIPFQSSENLLNKSLMYVIHNNFNVNGIMKIIEKMFKNNMDDIEMEDNGDIQNLKIKEYNIDSNKYKLTYFSFKEYCLNEVENGKDCMNYMEKDVTQIANKIDSKFYSKHFKEINLLKHNLNELANLLKWLNELNNEIFYFFENVIDSKNIINNMMTSKSRRALPFINHFEEMVYNLKNADNSFSFHNMIMQFGDELNIIIKNALVEYVYLHKQAKEHMKQLEKYMEKNVKVLTKMHKKIFLSIFYITSDINKTNDKIDFLINKNLNEFKEWVIHENKKCTDNLKKIKSNIDFNFENINEVFDNSKEKLKNDYISFIDISKYLSFQNPNKTILSIIHFLNNKYSDDVDIIFLYNEEYVEFNINDITYENDTSKNNDKSETPKGYIKFETNFNFTDLDIIETSKYEEVLKSYNIDNNSNFKHINKNNFEKIIDDIILNNEMLENGTWIKEKTFQNNNNNNISYNDIYNEIQKDTKYIENSINNIDNNFSFKPSIINFIQSIKKLFNNFIFNFDNYLCSFEKNFDSQDINIHDCVDAADNCINNPIPIEENKKFENEADAQQENLIVDSEKEIKAILENEPNKSEIKMNTSSIELTDYQKNEHTEVLLNDLKMALKNKIMHELESAIKEIVENEVSDVLDDDFPDDDFSDELENYEKGDESNKINTKIIDATKYEGGNNYNRTEHLQENKTELVHSGELDFYKNNIFSTGIVKKNVFDDASDGHLKENDEHLKENDEHLKENDEHLKENDEHLKENDEHLKENDEHLKENDEHLKENDEHLKESDEHLKENDEHLKENDEHLKESDEHSEESGGNSEYDENDENSDIVERQSNDDDIDNGIDENETTEKNRLNFSILHSSNLKYLWRTPIIKQLYNMYIEHRKGYMYNKNDENVDIYEIDKNELENQNNDVNSLNFKEELKNIKDNIFYAVPDIYYIYDILDTYQKNKNNAYEPNKSEIKMNTSSIELTDYQKNEHTEVLLNDLKMALKNKIMHELESAIKEIVENEVSDVLDDDFPDDDFSDELENYEKGDESNKINTKIIDATKYEGGNNYNRTEHLQENKTELVHSGELDFYKNNIFSTGIVKKNVFDDASDGHLKENDEHLKENDEHLKENDEHLKESDEHLKENDEHLKENDEHLKESDEHSEESGGNSEYDENDENSDIVERQSNDDDIDNGIDENETTEKNRLNFSILHSSNLKYLWRTPIIKQLYNMYIEHRKGYMYNKNDENVDIYEIDKNELENQNNDVNSLNFKEELKNIKDNIFYAVPDIYYIYDILDTYQKNKNNASSNNFFYNTFYGNDYLMIKSKGVNIETFIYPYFETLNLQLNEAHTCSSGNYYSCMKNYINNNIDKEKLNKKTVFIYLGIFKDEVFKLTNSKLDDLKKFHLQQFLNKDIEYQFFNNFLVQKHKEESEFFRKLKFYTVHHSQRTDTLMYGVDFNFYVSYFSKGDINHLPFSYYYDSIIYFKVILASSKYGDQEIVPIDDDIINLGLMLSLDNKNKNVHYLIKPEVIEDTQYGMFKKKKGIVKLYKVTYGNVKIIPSKDKYKMHVTRNMNVILQKEVTFNSNNNKRTLYYIDIFYDKMSEIMKNNMNLELFGKTFFLHLEKK